MAAPTVESVYPSDLQEGVVLGASIEITFSREIDQTTMSRAFIVEGPDTDRWTGPDFALWDRPATPEPDFYLDSPNYKGILQGTFSYEKLNAAGDSVSSPTYSPGSSSFKTKVTFTPTKHMSASTQYRVYIAGDEESTDDIKVGIASRTVGDTELGANSGDGEVTFTGGYTGTSNDQYVVEITLGGGPGTGQYSWWRTSNPLDIRTGTVSQNEVLLSYGVYLSFNNDTFVVGDTYTANVVVPEYMANTYTWTFTTGSGSIEAVPSTTSTSVLGDVGVPTAPVVFEVDESNPTDGAVRVSRTKRTFTVTFTKDLGSVSEDQVIIDLIPVLGQYLGSDGNLDIPKVLSVSGKTLTIQI